MNYVFRQKINISDLVSGIKPSTVLLAGPEAELLELYASLLNSREFLTHICSDHAQIHHYVDQHRPDLAIVSLHFFDGRENLAKMFFSTLRDLFPDLKILTFSLGSEHNFIKELMAAGLSGHIDRRLTKPLDLTLLAENILLFK